MMIRIPGM